MNRSFCAAVLAAAVSLLISGCPNKTAESPKLPPPPNPTTIAGKPVGEGPSGQRPNAPAQMRPIDNGDNGDIDRLAGLSVADIEEFWTGAYGPPLQGKFTPVNEIFSWDERFKHGEFCSPGANYKFGRTYHLYNAAWCPAPPPYRNCSSTDPPQCWPAENTIGWDRGKLMPDMQNVAGDLGITVVLAHEYGHSIQNTTAGLIQGDSVEWKTTAEQQADCFAGVYMRWVVDGKSPRFTLSTGTGLTNVLVAMIMLSDPLLSQQDPLQPYQAHGSAFERVTAFQMGFDNGAGDCAKINPDEIAQRRANYPKNLLQQGRTGEVAIDQDAVKGVTEALTKVFTPASAPTVSFDTSSCPDARPSPPASYCPSSNNIAVDVNRLMLMGTRLSRGTPLATLGLLSGNAPFGDYTAFSVVVSRYMLAMQKQRGGLSLDNTNAGLRTACLTGVATTKLAKGIPVSGGKTVTLTGGDLDEAVAGLLNNGLVAANINGDFAPSGFARVDAFRTGVLGNEEGCYKQWP